VTKIAIFFGSDDGNTQSIAHRIALRLGVETVDIYDISEVTQLNFLDYDKLILGIPTWDFGQIQSDWEDFWSDVEEIDFSGKTVAFVGLGDQFGYADFFLDAMGLLYNVVSKTATNIVGYWPVDGYDYVASKAEITLGDDAKKWFVGLALDEDQQAELSSSRLNLWCSQIHAQFNMRSELIEVTD
jgi:flavodoxin I